ncbi:uncharacterized protein LOC111093708 isoform X1 [Canis lupus familiaris]|uniref:uncharacterized protein LOC111093708 isoform X1 n=1 Tax=Canis lupus familiaris TaxID=9615 RepID=UPI000BAA1A8A|nr:uncharacterized protein LOC111093708 isoform X1 [Canis lupus familiaris]XP_038301134.1 uncharacterized protein LOC111093708 isoform X1 [Canis lupus familiaris]XP_038439005.1 uncharacterized protein LOC111093708 isoform X1 [Canis lupus familiaris]|eukprot:XP_022269461.1 uncharacterized protein LOC111093708 isoform X1 [Canis lupus familiaris]
MPQEDIILSNLQKRKIMGKDNGILKADLARDFNLLATMFSQTGHSEALPSYIYFFPDRWRRGEPSPLDCVPVVCLSYLHMGWDIWNSKDYTVSAQPLTCWMGHVFSTCYCPYLDYCIHLLTLFSICISDSCQRKRPKICLSLPRRRSPQNFPLMGREIRWNMSSEICWLPCCQSCPEERCSHQTTPSVFLGRFADSGHFI